MEQHHSQPLLQNINVVPVGKSFLSRFSNRDYQAGIKEKVFFCPGFGNQGKKGLCSRLVPLTGNKGATSADVADTPFDPITDRDQRSFFNIFPFPSFPFHSVFSFQLKKKRKSYKLSVTIFTKRIIQSSFFMWEIIQASLVSHKLIIKKTALSQCHKHTVTTTIPQRIRKPDYLPSAVQVPPS